MTTVNINKKSTYANTDSIYILNASGQQELLDPAAFAPPSNNPNNWSLINSWTYSSAISSVSFSGLSYYKDIMIIVKAVTPVSDTVFRKFQVSSDGGSTFENIMTVQGSTNNLTITGSASLSTKNDMILINNFNTTLAHKPLQITSDVEVTGIRPVCVETTNVLNYIKFTNSDSSNFTGGSIYVYGRG